MGQTLIKLIQFLCDYFGCKLAGQDKKQAHSSYKSNFVIEIDVRDGNASGNSSILQDCFGYSVFFFSYEVEYHSFKVCEELFWDFDEDGTKSVD